MKTVYQHDVIPKYHIDCPHDSNRECAKHMLLWLLFDKNPRIVTPPDEMCFSYHSRGQAEEAYEELIKNWKKS